MLFRSLKEEKIYETYKFSKDKNKNSIKNTAYGRQIVAVKSPPTTNQVSCVMCHMFYATCHVSPVMSHLSHVTNINSDIQGSSPC